MFSIADLQTAEEGPDYSEAEEEAENAEDEDSDPSMNVYPIRASFSITKVSHTP